MIRFVTLLTLLVSLSACGVVDRLSPGQHGKPLRSERLTFDGITFRARIRHTTEDRRGFAVEVRDATRSLSGALEKGQFEAVKYCIGRFGNSDMEWTSNSPLDTPEEVQLTESGNLIMTGRCTAR